MRGIGCPPGCQHPGPGPIALNPRACSTPTRTQLGAVGNVLLCFISICASRTPLAILRQAVLLGSSAALLFASFLSMSHRFILVPVDILPQFRLSPPRHQNQPCPRHIHQSPASPLWPSQACMQAEGLSSCSMPSTVSGSGNTPGDEALQLPLEAQSGRGRGESDKTRELLHREWGAGDLDVSGRPHQTGST